jgi:hypothetical protein
MEGCRRREKKRTLKKCGFGGQVVEKAFVGPCPVRVVAVVVECRCQNRRFGVRG